MKLQKTIHGDLQITADHDERNQLREDRGADADFESDKYTAEMLEPVICNSEYDWVLPEEIGALTDAPILGTRDQEGKPEACFWFPNYQVTSPQRELHEHGVCIFQKV